MTVATILILLIFNFFKISCLNISYDDENNSYHRCHYMNIFKEPIFYNCYIFKYTNNFNKNECCQLYRKQRIEDKKAQLYSLQEILKNTLSEEDLKDIQNLFPMINDKVLSVNDNKNFLSLGNKNRNINDIDDLLIEFNNRYFNLKDIRVNILNNNNNSNKIIKNYDSYFNYVKEETNFLKKKDELLQNSPFYSKTCFKSIHGEKCIKKNSKDIEETKNLDIDEDLDYELLEAHRGGDEYLTNGHNEGDGYNENDHYNNSSNSNHQNTENYEKGRSGRNSKNNNKQYNEYDSFDDSSKSSPTSFYSMSKNFALVNVLSQNPRKIVQKYVEFKEHLSDSKEKLTNFFDKEYYNTTQTLSAVLADDIKKAVEDSEDHEEDSNNNNNKNANNTNKGLFSSFFDDLVSVFYFPKRNIEL
ncbi:hypothetical protein MKS88_003719 [Plasmodium brasilianum]|uniref:Uncharacterized protein n=2 Tax=Plasmodium (Plasmodium) TaxID=418103 RepID=A0A1D3SMR4_PLAMA|nr:conserved Plasmodium protein, unknown function [Plasmodium malariae]KAI4837249.1 hypothetical protein MKS88_003719 [Plasmodium brasilianum]SCO93131.1 conserved Plasmodium protein, unknown function [Plasmodium malariae]